MLLEPDITTADAESFFDNAVFTRPARDDGARGVWFRTTVWVRPLVDVLAVSAAVLAVGGAEAVSLAFAALVLAGLATEWRRPVPLGASAADEARFVAVRAGLPVVALLPFATAPRLSWMALGAAGAVLFGRAVAYGAVRIGRRAGRVVEPVMLLGSGDHVLALRERIWAHPELGLQPKIATSVSLTGDASVFLSEDEIDRCVKADRVKRLVVCGGSGYDAELVSTVRAARSSFETLYLPGPQQPTLGLPAVGTEVLAGHPVFRLAGGPNRLGARFAKRALDIVGASLLVLLLSPVLLAAALAVRLTSSGPILFRQPRIGRHGELFDMLKFRSFPTDHEDVKQALKLDECPLPVGRLLRRTSIDELPQLFNVLRGEMSLVGPRPERPAFAEPLSAKIPDYDARHRVAGGLTGLAQVHGYWGISEIEARVRLDNHYIETWSLWSDLGVLVRTIPAVIVKSFS